MLFADSAPFDLGIISIIIQLIFLEGILSIDNAAVLGAMVSVLPDNKPVPYPHPLKFLQHFTDRVLGMQQMAALKVGLLGAYLGRGMMLFLASYVIQNPWLRLIGAAYLIKLAFEHLPSYSNGGDGEAADGHGNQRLAHASFWLVVLNVELADLAFSLDNVVAAVALSNELWVVMVGVALGILTMRFAAGIFTHLIEREPILAPAAYVLVLNIGIELILEDFHIMEFHGMAKFVISISTLLLALAYAHFHFLHGVDPLLRLIGKFMVAANKLLNLIFWPVAWLFKTVSRGVSTLFPGKDNPAI